MSFQALGSNFAKCLFPELLKGPGDSFNGSRRQGLCRSSRPTEAKWTIVFVLCRGEKGRDAIVDEEVKSKYTEVIALYRRMQVLAFELEASFKLARYLSARRENAKCASGSNCVCYVQGRFLYCSVIKTDLGQQSL